MGLKPYAPDRLFSYCGGNLQVNGSGDKLKLEDFRPTNKRKKWGLGLLILGVFGVLSFVFQATVIDVGTVIFGIIFYLGVAAGGLFLLLKEPDPARIAEKAEKEEKTIQMLLGQLESATGVGAVIAYEKLVAVIVKKNQPETRVRLESALESINFDKSRIESKFLGSVRNLDGPLFGSENKKLVRVFKDWVIAGEFGYNFDISTRGQVNVDGGFSYDNKGRQIDNRTASLQLATQDWSHTFKISPDQADEARRILQQLAAIVEQMKPQGVSAADIEAAMEKIVSKSGKSQAERLEELSNLRFQRLLSDQEFEKAKAKILDI